MTSRLAAQAFVGALCTFASINAFAQSGSYAWQNSGEGTAIDVKGVHHAGDQYPGRRAPWNFSDRIAATAPDYPREDRGLHHEGSGLFRVVIDPKSGVPTQVIALKSTGYSRLDAAAITALRRWRWKPGTWKEVDLPVAFTMHGTGRPPPGAIRLRP